MKNKVEIGMNKTGLGTAPLKAPEMLDREDDAFKAFAQADEDVSPKLSYVDIKQQYNRESGAVGTLPPPSTLKGNLISGFEKLTGSSPEMLIDKLGERMAFERSGSRLYEAFIAKCETVLPAESLGFLHEILADEKRHFLLLNEAIQSLGADPTAMTPCANVAAVSSMGLIQVVNDPRTSVSQAGTAILTAELVDNDGWDLLIKLTADAGLADWTKEFQAAKESEERHLLQIRSWLNEMVMKNDATEFQSPTVTH